MPHLASEALGGLTGRLVTLGLLHAVWIGLLVASLAAIALRLVPHRRRQVRHSLLLAALALAVLGPLFATSLQRSRGRSRESEPVEVPAARIRVIPGRLVTRTTDRPAVRPKVESVSTLATLRAWAFALVSRAQAGVDTLQPFVLAVWLVGVALLMLFLALGVRASRNLRRDAWAAPGPIQERSDRLSRELGLRGGPPVLVHPHLGEPCLCGLVRPAILLPGSWLAGAEDDRLEAVLAHELAHAWRLDLPVNLVQRLIEVVLFFHPAVLWLSRSLRRQRELCADALAVSLTGNPLALAEALESFARSRPARHRSTLLGESLGGDGLSLLSRIQEILGMTPTRPPARLWPLVALPAAILGALFSASVGLAQEPPKLASDDAPRSLPHPVRDSEYPIQKEDSNEADRDDFVGESRQRGLIDARTDDTPFSNRQICYEIRYVETDASSWRDRLKERFHPVEVEGEANESAWLLDKEKTSDFIKLTLESESTNLLQGPKVTSFDGAHVTIDNTSQLSYVAEVEPDREPGSLVFKPAIKNLKLGTTIELSGTLQPSETNLKIGLRDKALVAIHALRRTAESVDGQIAAQYQVPMTTERNYRLACSIPDGSTLMVSLGFQERSGQLSRVAGAAVALLEATGVPLKTRGETTERLVLITPRRIILEDKAIRVGIPGIERPVFRVGEL